MNEKAELRKQVRQLEKELARKNKQYLKCLEKNMALQVRCNGLRDRIKHICQRGC